jgi:hypothetical protein
MAEIRLLLVNLLFWSLWVRRYVEAFAALDRGGNILEVCPGLVLLVFLQKLARALYACGRAFVNGRGPILD